MHDGAPAAERDGERLAVDARLEHAVDRVEEVVAVELRVEAEDAAAEHAVEQLVPPRADRERLGVRPRDVPERDDRRARQPVADHARQQREVVVLHEDDRDPRTSLPATTASANFALTVRYCSKSDDAERRPHVRDVAERPQAFVGEAAVVAGLLLGRQPDAAQLVGGRVGRHGDAVVRVDGVAVGACRCRARSRCPSTRASPARAR